LYRRIRNTLRWLLGSLDGFSEAETVPYAELPELERWVLHRLTEIDARVRQAVATHDWSGVYPEIHAFCATDLSAFYFDIRKDALYCDRADSLRRRAARTVLDVMHRCLCKWLAPVLVFTAEEAWLARFPEEEGSVHLLDFVFVPEGWKDDALAAKWARVREIRRQVTSILEPERQAGKLGSSLRADMQIFTNEEDRALLTEAEWCEICIVSDVKLPGDGGFIASQLPRVAWSLSLGTKCDRCWRVLPEVGSGPSGKHPTLCLRCDDAVESLT
jgi:isoleucyl-tRNA synthetase